MDAYVRPMAWRGSKMMGVSAQRAKINVAVATWEWPAYFSPELREKGIKLTLGQVGAARAPHRADRQQGRGPLRDLHRPPSMRPRRRATTTR